MQYAIVDLTINQVIPRRGALTFTSLARVYFPDGSTADSAHPGHEIPPQYGEENEPSPVFRIYEVIIVDIGSGPIVASVSDPVFDPVADTVTVTRTLEAAPVVNPEDTPLTPEDIERLLLGLPSVTRAIIDTAKRDRGTPIP